MIFFAVINDKETNFVSTPIFQSSKRLESNGTEDQFSVQ
jgi:hypothetical protein